MSSYSNQQASNFLIFNLYYQDMLTPKLKFTACQKVHVTAALVRSTLFQDISFLLYFLFLTFIFSFNWCFRDEKKEKQTFSYLLSKNWNLANFFTDASISQEIQISDNLSGFCSPKFDNFMTSMAISWNKKGNEQCSSISEKSDRTLAMLT